MHLFKGSTKMKYYRVIGVLTKRLKRILLLCCCILLLTSVLIVKSIIHIRDDVSGKYHLTCHSPFASENSPWFPYNDDTGLFFPINIKSACHHGNPSILMPINSAITNFDRRQRMRDELEGRYSRKERNAAVMIFFVGFPNGNQYATKEVSEIQNKLMNESRTYDDIIQINMEDSYRKIVQKSISVLYWITQYCTNPEFVVKMDDDVRVNMTNMVVLLRETKKNQSNFIMGEQRLGERPARPSWDKKFWRNAITTDEYPHSTYPPFVPGGLMAYPITTAVLLYGQAIRMKPIWLDDVYISGICAKKLGIPILPMNDWQHLTSTS